MPLQLNITDESLQTAFQSHLDSLLTTGNYDNPVKRVMNDLLGYSGLMKGELSTKIKLFMEQQIETPEFQAILGKSIADEMAKRAVDSLEKKDKR